jgi:hypothetical protein
MFSPSLPTSCVRSSSRPDSAPGPACLDRLEHLLGEGQELVVVRDRLGLTADGDHRALLRVVVEAVSDLPFRGRAVRALGRAGHTLLAQQANGGLDVPVRLLQRALAVHHRRAGLVAQLFDECSRDLSHSS